MRHGCGCRCRCRCCCRHCFEWLFRVWFRRGAPTWRRSSAKRERSARPSPAHTSHRPAAHVCSHARTHYNTHCSTSTRAAADTQIRSAVSASEYAKYGASTARASSDMPKALELLKNIILPTTITPPCKDARTREHTHAALSGTAGGTVRRQATGEHCQARYSGPRRASLHLEAIGDRASTTVDSSRRRARLPPSAQATGSNSRGVAAQRMRGCPLRLACCVLRVHLCL